MSRFSSEKDALAGVACILLATVLWPLSKLGNASDFFVVEEVLRPLVLNAMVAVTGFVGGLILFRYVTGAALFATGLLVLWQFWFVLERVGRWISNQHVESVSLLLSLILLMFGYLIIANMNRKIAKVAAFALAAALAGMLAPPAAMLAQAQLYQARHESHLSQSPLPVTPVTQTPDIYHVLLDGYARADVLRILFGMDNSQFLHALRERGFKVADRATSNYNQTVLSTASFLGMDYLDSLAKSAKGEPKMMRALIARQARQSATVLTLSNNGYKLESTPTIYSKLNFNWGESKPSQPFCAVTLLQLKYYSRTPLHLWCKYMGESPGAFFRWAFHVAMTRGPVETGAPVFEFRHVLSPHPPFMLDVNGDPSEPPPRVGWTPKSGNDYTQGKSQFRAEYRRGYADQVRGLNRHVLHLVDLLLQNPRPKIIILHGDHGSGLYMNQNDRVSTCHWERFSPLLAVYSSDGRLQREIPDDISLVNLYRFVFRIYFGVNVPILPDKHYYVPWNDLTRADAVEVHQPCVLHDNAIAGHWDR